MMFGNYAVYANWNELQQVAEGKQLWLIKIELEYSIFNIQSRTVIFHQERLNQKSNWQSLYSNF